MALLLYRINPIPDNLITPWLSRVDQSVQTPTEQEPLYSPKNFTSSLDFNSELVSLHQKLKLLSEKIMKVINKLELSTIKNSKRFHNDPKK